MQEFNCETVGGYTANQDTRLPKATLDICLLAMIEYGDSYGYELVEVLKREGFPLTNERSVYPLLKRLEAYLQASSGGPARKYYRISEDGRNALCTRARCTFEIHDTARRIVTSRIDLE